MIPDTAFSNIKSRLERKLIADDPQWPYDLMIELENQYPNFWFYACLYLPLTEQIMIFGFIKPEYDTR